MEPARGPGTLPSSPGDGASIRRLAVATFGILALELALIRWTSGQIRIFAYFNNLVLITSFLGMGLGVALGPRRPRLVHGTLPLLLLLSGILAFSEPLGLVSMKFPDSAIHLWGSEAAPQRTAMLANLGTFLLLVGMVIGVFVLAGSAVGDAFARLPPLRAYAADLAGSLLGIVTMAAATQAGATPRAWLFIGAAPIAWLCRTPLALCCLGGIVALGHLSGVGAIYSPYNRIDLGLRPEPWPSISLSVNRDFHQYMHDLSEKTLEDPEIPAPLRHRLAVYRAVYDLPFLVNPRRERALVVGAGTGNDVEAALRAGYREVVSCDIDGTILDLGKELHPEAPYDDPRARRVRDDARAFFEQYQGPPFDVVCYGLLDSHAMFASMSSLRLDNYVYTTEGIRGAWEHVAPQGHLALSFSIFAGPWIRDRLYWTIADATGIEPTVVLHNMHYGATFLVARPGATIDPGPLRIFPAGPPPAPRESVRTTSDDWPFLYVRPGAFPWGYLAVLGAVAAVAAAGIPFAFGRRTLTTSFDVPLFLMGAAFLLIETRGVTALSLLFGSTWTVNSAVFASILSMALLGNLAVMRFGFRRPLPWFALLLASVALVWAVDLAALNRFSLPVRGLLGSLLHGLPIGIAGVIVPILLERSRNASASLGSNLLGAVLGGCLEYLSMAVGLSALALLALALYLGALLAVLREHGRGPRFRGAERALSAPAARTAGT